jgi:hypothetical protein
VIGAITAGLYAGGVPPVTNSYESIATVTVGGGGASTITFSSIPSTFKHLQVRFFFQDNRGTYGSDDIGFRVGNGSIDTGNNYAWHDLYGNGSSAAAQNVTSTSRMELNNASGTGVASNFGAGVMDILDYANTSKYKTIRSLHGNDVNGTVSGFGGRIALDSGLWQNTAAISTIQFAPLYGSSFNQYSHAALYGIKG